MESILNDLLGYPLRVVGKRSLNKLPGSSIDQQTSTLDKMNPAKLILCNVELDAGTSLLKT